MLTDITEHMKKGQKVKGDSQEERFAPILQGKSEKESLIADNPVASAQFFFFHFMIQVFIKHVLGVDADHTGL